MTLQQTASPLRHQGRQRESDREHPTQEAMSRRRHHTGGGGGGCRVQALLSGRMDGNISGESEGLFEWSLNELAVRMSARGWWGRVSSATGFIVEHSITSLWPCIPRLAHSRPATASRSSSEYRWPRGKIRSNLYTGSKAALFTLNFDPPSSAPLPIFRSLISTTRCSSRVSTKSSSGTSA
jgi:hypothetical protein